MANIIKIFIILTVIFGLSFSVYWLWQRQPKNTASNEQASTQTVVKSNETQEQQNSLFAKPEPGQILTIGKNTLIGKTEPKTRIILLGDQLSEILTTNDEGTFSTETSFPSGISLIQAVILNQDLTENKSETFSIFASKENSSGQTYIAGTVTKIFSGTITIRTQTKDLEIKTTKETIFTNSQTSPSPSPKTTKTATENENVRVGDYIVAIGQKISGNLETATKIEIYRENKPVISTKYATVKITSPAKSNIFSATNTKDNKLLEFTIEKKTQILEKEKKVSTPSIAKDKTAIIFYQTEDKDNLVLKIHIL